MVSSSKDYSIEDRIWQNPTQMSVDTCDGLERTSDGVGLCAGEDFDAHAAIFDACKRAEPKQTTSLERWSHWTSACAVIWFIFEYSMKVSHPATRDVDESTVELCISPLPRRVGTKRDNEPHGGQKKKQTHKRSGVVQRLEDV